MAGLISDGKSHTPRSNSKEHWLRADGIRYTNSAAKFWAGLLDEARDEYPDSTTIELAAPVSEGFEPKHLFPELMLGKEFTRLLTADFHEALADAIKELEMLGPPAAIHARLWAGQKEILSRDLPYDCVDAELFPFLAVWPLTWAHIPCALWDSDYVHGAINALETAHGGLYRVGLVLARKHIGDGLYQVCLSLNNLTAGPLTAPD